MILDIFAEYIPDGDTILATAYVLDEDDEVFHPEMVKEGEARILFLGNSITKPVTFDRRMGNSDGAFKFTFSHPPKIKNLQFQVNVTLFDDSEFTKTVSIITEGDVHIPLTQNVMPNPQDTRSKIRKEEEGL